MSEDEDVRSRNGMRLWYAGLGLMFGMGGLGLGRGQALSGRLLEVTELGTGKKCDGMMV